MGVGAKSDGLRFAPPSLRLANFAESLASDLGGAGLAPNKYIWFNSNTNHNSFLIEGAITNPTTGGISPNPHAPGGLRPVHAVQWHFNQPIASRNKS